MAYIGRGIDKLSNIEKLDVITFDGSSSYSLTKNSVAFTPSSANSLQVSIDGVVQAGNFTVSGSTIDFGTAVASTSTNDFIFHYGTGLITTPADGTVTTAKLADSSVTSAKLASGVGGKVLQVVSATKTDTFSSASTSFTDLTGLSVSITPATTSSKILILCSLSVAASTGGGPQLRLMRDSTAIAIGDTDGNRARVTTSFVISSTGDMDSASMNFVDSPATTSATTYKVQGFAYNTNILYVNRTIDDADQVYRQRGVSTITAMEIGA